MRLFVTLCLFGRSYSSWPSCQMVGKVYRYNTSTNNAHFCNLAGYGAIAGCFLDNCGETDKFAASRIESCATVCHTLPECSHWSYGTEEGMTKCWFRSSDAHLEDAEGYSSGAKDCTPEGTTKLVKGNTDCWVEGFDYSQCCEEHFGPNGNAQCWDGLFNYNKCCFPKTEL